MDAFRVTSMLSYVINTLLSNAGFKFEGTEGAVRYLHEIQIRDAGHCVNRKCRCGVASKIKLSRDDFQTWIRN